MSDVGACLEVVSAVPSLQDLACQTYCMKLMLSGEYSCLCLRLIRQCVHRAIDAENDLPGEEVTEDVRERTCRVVKAARWYAHNMLFRCGAILSAPFVDWRLVGTHVKVIGDAFLRVRRGAYVTLVSRPLLPDSDTELDSSAESQRLVTTNTVVIVRGRINEPIANRTRSCLCFRNEPEWVVQDRAGASYSGLGG